MVQWVVNVDVLITATAVDVVGTSGIPNKNKKMKYNTKLKRHGHVVL